MGCMHFSIASYPEEYGLEAETSDLTEVQASHPQFAMGSSPEYDTNFPFVCLLVIEGFNL